LEEMKESQEEEKNAGDLQHDIDLLKENDEGF